MFKPLLKYERFNEQTYRVYLSVNPEYDFDLHYGSMEEIDEFIELFELLLSNLKVDFNKNEKGKNK